MSEINNTIQDSSPSVTLTVGELRVLIREEIRTVISQNGDGDKIALSSQSREAPKPYLTIKEAAQMARLSQSAIRLFISKRELKAHKVGRRVIIKRTDLQTFLESRPIELLPD